MLGINELHILYAKQAKYICKIYGKSMMGKNQLHISFAKQARYICKSMANR